MLGTYDPDLPLPSVGRQPIPARVASAAPAAYLKRGYRKLAPEGVGESVPHRPYRSWCKPPYIHSTIPVPANLLNHKRFRAMMRIGPGMPSTSTGSLMPTADSRALGTRITSRSRTPSLPPRSQVLTFLPPQRKPFPRPSLVLSAPPRLRVKSHPSFDLLRQRLHRSEDGAAVIAKTGILKFERIGTP